MLPRLDAEKISSRIRASRRSMPLPLGRMPQPMDFRSWGLSVVRGGIGTGKTTISRKLIQNFSSDEDVKFEFYPVLDPKFESELVLLQHLVDLFGIEEDAGSAVIECRNQIEHHLIKAGVEDGRVLVLVIDEGQNLKGEFLDVFRTLLNFETDDFKLLQLVIFGQPEMTSIIHEYPNFEDRITFNFELGPLDFESVEGIIKHRLTEKGGGDREYFTTDAIRAIHNQTQGYPRKINKLCHQLLLNMMSEKAEMVSIEIVENTIGGKVPDGLIDQEEPEKAEAIKEEKEEPATYHAPQIWLFGARTTKRWPQRKQVLTPRRVARIFRR